MSRRHVLLAILSAFLTGCSTYAPPEIRGGRMVYPEHEVSFGLPPAPWRQADKVPGRFLVRSSRCAFYPGLFSEIVFVNGAGDSAIAFEADRLWQDLSAIPPQRIRDRLNQIGREEAGSISALSFVDDFSYSVKGPAISKQPQMVLEQSFLLKCEGQLFRCDRITYAYTIDEDDTCMLRALLWSEPSAYERNRAVLDKITASFRRIPPPTR